MEATEILLSIQKQLGDNLSLQQQQHGELKAMFAAMEQRQRKTEEENNACKAQRDDMAELVADHAGYIKRIRNTTRMLVASVVTIITGTALGVIKWFFFR